MIFFLIICNFLAESPTRRLAAPSKSTSVENQNERQPPTYYADNLPMGGKCSSVWFDLKLGVEWLGS